MSTSSKQSTGGTALLVLAVLFIALVILNQALVRGLRADLTDGRLYTLSDGTREVLEGLNEPVNLYLFFSDRAARDFAPLKTYASRVEEMLEEFERESGGKLRLEVIEPLPFSEEEDLASGYGLQAVSPGGAGDPIYFGLAGTNAVDDLEVIEFFQLDREEFLEYDLARMVYSLANPDQPVLGLMSSLPMSGGFDPAAGAPTEPWVVISQMRELFDVRSLGADVTRIDEDIDVLMVVHPKDLGDAALYAIDQFVMAGGRLIAFVDPHAEIEQPQSPGMGQSAAMFESRASDLNTLFRAWGFEVDPEFVVADGGTALEVRSSTTGAPVPHVGWLGLRTEELDADDVITADLSSVNLAVAGRLSETGETEGLSITPLAVSSSKAMLMPAGRFQFLPDPASLLEGFEPTGEIYTLAARIEGKIASAFPGGPPEGVETEGTHLAESAEAANLIVVADADLLADRMWVQAQNFFGQRIFSPFANNGALVVNALDNLTGSNALISVRSRGQFSRPFDRVDEIRREADDQFRAQQQRLQQQLEETEQKLAELQTVRDDDNPLILSPEQRAEIERFREENLRIRKDLREVNRNMDRDIERLGTTLKVLNIVLVPLLVAGLALLLSGWRNRRRRAAREGAA